MGLNYDLEDNSENLRRINHLKKINKANKTLFAENARFSSIMCVLCALKNGNNLIWYIEMLCI